MADEEGVPEFYSDVLDFTLNPYSVAITFGLSQRRQAQGKPTPADDQVVVRMSLQQAKVLSMLLRRTLSAYERENRLEVALPSGVYTQLGVAREDWPDPDRDS